MRKRKSKVARKESFGESAIESLGDFIKAMDRGERITVKRVKLNLEPRQYTGGEIRWTRERLQVSQAIFARLMGVSVKAVESWEAGTNTPSGPVCRLLEEININPMAFLQRHLFQSAETADASLIGHAVK